MKHLKEASVAMDNNEFVKVAGNAVVFEIQDGPVNEPGSKAGCQARDMIDFCLHLIVSLDNSYPCEENKETIMHLERALHWQDERTKDRMDRGVEGKNLK